jgi:hypothetical protein
MQQGWLQSTPPCFGDLISTVRLRVGFPRPYLASENITSPNLIQPPRQQQHPHRATKPRRYHLNRLITARELSGGEACIHHSCRRAACSALVGDTASRLSRVTERTPSHRAALPMDAAGWVRLILKCNTTGRGNASAGGEVGEFRPASGIMVPSGLPEARQIHNEAK